MSFFEKMFHSNKDEEKKENEVENTSENKNENFENIESNINDLENVAEDLKNVNPEKAAENLEKNEELKEKLKFAASLLTTLGFGAALVLSFTERVGATDLVADVPGMVNELVMGVSFVATAVSGALTQLRMEKMNKTKPEDETNQTAVA